MQVENIEESFIWLDEKQGIIDYASATKNKPKELRISLDNDDSLCPGIRILCCEAKFTHVFFYS